MFFRRRPHLPAGWKLYFLICSALTLWSQSTGGIQGTVTDSSGAPLANATVTVTNRATAQRQVIKSDNAGLYAAPSLQPGTYSVEATAPGLQTTTAANVVVSVSTVSRQDFSLGVAAANTSIQIESTAPVVETTSSSLGAVVNQKTVQEIPLNGRHFVDLAMLVPGSVTPPQNGFLTAPLRGQGSFSFNSAGGREDAVNFMINGINMNDISQNQVTFQPTINTVEEAKIDNSTFSAEYGRNAGSIVNIATRAGTNDLHGEVYEFLRNAALDARNYTNPKGVRQSPFVRNQFGGDTGFPIKRDKSFLYLSYEQLTQRQSLPLNTVVLSASQRATAAASSDPIVKSLLPLIPLANSSSNVFVGNAIAPVDIYQGTANFTQSFSESNRFNAYYAMQQDQRDEPTSGGNNLPNFGDQRHGVRQLLTLNDTQTISPTLVNEARAGYNRIHIVFAAQNTLNAADYGIDSGVNAAIGLPQISVSGAFALGGLSGYPQGRGDDTITTSDTLSWIHGNHSVKFGGEYRQSIADSFSETPGFFGFANVQAFLADQANSFNSNTSNRSNRVYIPAVGFFVQDAYKLRRNFTLTLGLRYDWNGTPTEAENRFVVFDPTSDSLDHIGQQGGPAYAYNQSALNFQPHVGFAWDIGGDGKTVIRSAFATFVDQPNVGLVTGLVGNPPYSVPVSFSPTTAVPTVSFGNAYALAGGSIAPTSVAHNYRNATVNSWNFNIERQFGNDYGLTASYVGSKGSNLNIARNYNQPVNGVLPYPRLSSSSSIDPGLPLSNITVYESDGNSSYQALWLTLQKRLAKGLQFSGSYTWSKSIDENSRNIEGVVIQDSYNIRGDRGLSDFDARQRFVLSGVYDLPFHQNRLVDGWQISLIETLQSGNPMTFLTSNRKLTGLTTVRPNVVAPLITGLSPASNGAASFIGDLQNPQALVASNGFGDLGRNAVIGPGFADLDISLVKNTRIFERLTWQFRADAFDVFNQANFGQPGLTVGTQTLGLISSTRFPTGDSGSSRQLQLSMKLIF
ncbi:MAG TPA: TonB-dependent receptor [Bryobacteraceae bacterium]|nr:TonB-dependent receptor [Bryobacteraceae bacterium]